MTAWQITGTVMLWSVISKLNFHCTAIFLFMSFYGISLNFWTAFLYYLFEMLLHYSIIVYLVFHITVVFKGSSFCLLTRLQAELRNCSLIPGRGNIFFSSPKCPDWLNQSPHSYSTDARDFFLGPEKPRYNLTTLLQLMLTLRIERAIILLPLSATMVWTGTILLAVLKCLSTAEFRFWQRMQCTACHA